MAKSIQYYTIPSPYMILNIIWFQRLVISSHPRKHHGFWVVARGGRCTCLLGISAAFLEDYGWKNPNWDDFPGKSMDFHVEHLWLPEFCGIRKVVQTAIFMEKQPFRVVGQCHRSTRPGKHTKSIKKLLKTAIEIVDLPIKNSDFP